MAIVDLLGHLAAGLRMGLALLAAMMLIQRAPGIPADPAVLARGWRVNSLCWMLLAIAALAFSPFRAAYLLDAPWLTLTIKRAGDCFASGLACAAFTWRMASRQRMGGVPERRVRINAATSSLLVAGMCAAAFT